MPAFCRTQAWVRSLPHAVADFAHSVHALKASAVKSVYVGVRGTCAHDGLDLLDERVVGHLERQVAEVLVRRLSDVPTLFTAAMVCGS